MAKQDRVLILKFSVDGGLYDQYWALVPPPASSTATTTSVSAMSGMTGMSGGSGGSRSGTAASGSHGSNNSGGDDGSMVLIRLVDSDHLFSFDDDDNESEDQIINNSSFITNVNLNTSYTTSIMAATTNNNHYDEDGMAETEEYLHSALIESLTGSSGSGSIDKNTDIIDNYNDDEEQQLLLQYNPQACPSGTINYLVSCSLYLYIL